LSPDVVGELDTVIYKLVPPGAFNNSNFGTSWTISALSFVTSFGAAPGVADTLTSLPSATADGTLRFVPSALYADSTFRLRITLQDITTGCDSTLERFIYVAPKPVPNFGSSLACDGQIVSFRDSSTIRSGQLNYFWNFGDTVTNATSIDQHPQYTYSGPGTYNVSLEVTSAYGYKKTITKQVTVFFRPDPDFGFTNVCLGNTSQFTNRSTLRGTQYTMTYEWALGNNTTSTQTNASAQYAAYGNYFVTLKARTSTGCERTVTKEVNVFPVPDADFTTGPPCSGLMTQFTNATSIGYGLVGYEWEFGDGTDETQKNPQHNYDASGTYSVKMIATSEFGCVDSVRKNVVVSVKPAANFSFTNTCLGDSVRFTNSSTITGSSIVNNEWDFGNGNTLTTNTSSFRQTYTAIGVYNVKLKVTAANNCADEKTVQVQVTEKPTADFTTSGTTCAGTALQFTNQSAIGSGNLSYNWNFGASSSSLTNPSHTFTSAGTYPVQLTATSGVGCSDMLTKNITVHPLPNANFSVVYTNQKSVREIKCVPADSTLYSYHWDMGDGTTFSQISPVYMYMNNGPFNIQLTTMSNEGCMSKSPGQNVLFSVSDGQLALTGNRLKVYPNPFYSQATINVSLAADDHLKITVIDQLGRLVTNIADGQFEKGEHEFSFADEKLAAGLYFVVVQTTDSREIKPLLKN
jgi:PKD repeat protein